MKVQFASCRMEYPGPELGELRDSNALREDRAALEGRLAEDGYLFFRGFLDRRAVLEARARILSFMDEKGALAAGTPLLSGLLPAGGRGVNMLGRKEITHDPAVLAVLDGPELHGFFRELYQGQARTFDYKWLRAVGNGSFTGCHFDVVYMGRGSERLHTVWIPLEDIPVEKGTLAMCKGSHRLDSFARLRETYGGMDVDRDLVDGWFSDDPREILSKFGGTWETTSYRAGDIITFGLWTMHASTTNTTGAWRVSCDIRYQPASEPADPRWVGDRPPGHSAAWMEGKGTPMAEARRNWGV
jgi:hypothetical protein